jgi:BirA family biotin operon repressor/biotin-[acetyl-CoA-carboxylase] ligase
MSTCPPELATAWLGRAWRHLPSCASTNDEAASWARAGAPAGAVVTADEQSAGRGRLRRVWHSPAGASLYFSVVLRPKVEPSQLPPVTLAAGVAVAEAIARFDVPARLKWPNDLLVATPAGERKVAGILTEAVTTGGRVEHVVVGIGVNLAVRAFPPELEAIATSLAHVRASDVDRSAFAAVLCERLESWIDCFVADGAAPVVAGWKRFAPIFGRRVRVNGHRPIEGVAEDLAPDGALLLRTDAGAIERVIAGELGDA